MMKRGRRRNDVYADSDAKDISMLFCPFVPTMLIVELHRSVDLPRLLGDVEFDLQFFLPQVVAKINQMQNVGCGFFVIWHWNIM